MTVHNTVFVRTVMRWLALVALRCAGWKTEGRKPDVPKFVVIAAPHTSNWDFFFTVCMAIVYRIDSRIMMKNTWFFWPVGPLLRWLGAIPIDRTRSNNVVAQAVEAFRQSDALVMVVPPSGTRRKVNYWKSGFYRIADGAGVPIALGFLDYRRKVGGFGPTFYPTGALSADMKVIRDFYRPIIGRHPLNKSDGITAVSGRPNIRPWGSP
jgi:1-acyl-sn-glycerol-3-phosphate acyltransferase